MPTTVEGGHDLSRAVVSMILMIDVDVGGQC
jgi:hypothetical protein